MALAAKLFQLETRHTADVLRPSDDVGDQILQVSRLFFLSFTSSNCTNSTTIRSRGQQALRWAKALAAKALAPLG